MQRTTEEADGPQPLLARQLYDSYRSAQQQQPDRALETARQLVLQGLLQEAQQTNSDASQTVTRLREGVDQAATGVLGDETAALRRAQQELDALAQQLDREVGRSGAAQAATQPDRGGARQAAGATQPGRAGSPPLAGATQPGRGNMAGTQPGGRGLPAGTQPDERQLAQNGRGAFPNARGTATAPGGIPGVIGAAQTQIGIAQTQSGRQIEPRQLANNQTQPGVPSGLRGQPGAGGNPLSQPQPEQQGMNQRLAGEARLATLPGVTPPGNQEDPNPQNAGGQDQQLAQGGGRGNPGLRVPNGTARGGFTSGATQPADLQFAATQPDDRGGIQGADNTGPITGTGYRNFTDNLRDVEEIVNDPRLRDQAATIRQNVTTLRQDYLRTARPPAWNIVQNTLNRPLTDLRGAIGQELQRRESRQAAIPLDRDAVPPAYQDQVRVYYERLGSGK